MKHIQIENISIGQERPVFVIAEAGVNHNGDFAIAKQLVDAAAAAGCDAVKFQTFKAEGVVTEEGEMAEYQKQNLGKEESQVAMLRKLELAYDAFPKLKAYCDQKGIIFMSTPHSEDAIDFLDPLVPAYKVGSGDLTNYRFLRKIAQKGKPMILGTGMATLKEVVNALKVIKDAGNNQVVMLHCTTNYPCPEDQVNLNAMTTMQQELECLVGYSDHTMGIHVPLMAAMRGAVIIEKHFTLDRSLPGPDQMNSLEPEELKQMTEIVKNIPTALGTYLIEGNPMIMGSYEKTPTPDEVKVAKVARKSVVAGRDIVAGEILTDDHLAVKRPATGIPANEYDSVIGKKVRQDIKADTLLKYEYLE